MAQVFLVNKRRRKTAHKRKTTHRRKRAVRRNPWFGDSAGHRRAAKKGWRKHRRHAMRRNPKRVHHRRRMRRNPRGLGNINAFMKHTLIPSSVGAVGALGLDVILGYVPLPAALQTGVFKPIVRLVGAGLLGLVASKVANRETGERVAAGAVTVVLYDLFKGVVSQAAPNLPLSGISGYPNLEFYSAGTPAGMGEYVSGALPFGGNTVVAPVGAGSAATMQEYVGW